jgi:hypothetical protein
MAALTILYTNAVVLHGVHDNMHINVVALHDGFNNLLYLLPHSAANVGAQIFL